MAKRSSMARRSDSLLLRRRGNNFLFFLEVIFYIRHGLLVIHSWRFDWLRSVRDSLLLEQ